MQCKILVTRSTNGSIGWLYYKHATIVYLEEKCFSKTECENLLC